MATSPARAEAEAEARLSPHRLEMIDRILAGATPLERFARHSAVRSFAHVRPWVGTLSKEIEMLQTPGEDGPEEEELQAYLVGKAEEVAAVLAELDRMGEQGDAEELARWATPRLRSVLVLRFDRLTREGPPKDDMENYLIGKQGVLDSLLSNLRQVVETASSSPGPDRPPAA